MLLSLAARAQTPSPSLSSATDVEVLAVVAERVVTDRQVVMDLLLKRPEVYRPGFRAKDIPASVFETAVQSYLLELMILEDNRLIGRESASDVEIRKALQVFQRKIGTAYRSFLRDFELSEADVRERLSRRIIVDKVLETRIDAAAAEIDARAAGKKTNSLEREAAGRKALEEWMGQLKARYRVQRLSTRQTETAMGGVQEAPDRAPSPTPSAQSR